MPDASTVVAFCALPPPMTGQRIASKTFLDLLRGRVRVVHVAPASRALRAVAGGFGVAYTRDWVASLRRLRATFRATPGATLYFCPSSSLLGLARDVATVAAVRGLAGRVVGHVHSGDHELHFAGRHRRLARWLARRIDAYCVSTETQCRKLAPAVAPTPVWAVTNVVDPSLRFDAAELDAALAARRARPGLSVLYLSNLVPSKGYLDVLRALAHAAGDVQARFVGTWMSAADRDAFLAERARLGLADRAHVLEPVQTRTAARALLADADVVCLPTSYPHEAQPLAVLEGMAAGCPVVSTAHCSLPEYVLDGETGVIVPAGDARAIARAFDRLRDDAARERMGRRAHALAGERFAPARALVPLLQALGADESPAPRGEGTPT